MAQGRSFRTGRSELPPLVDWLVRIRSDVEHRAVVIVMTTVDSDSRMLGHELDHLEHAVRTCDVGNGNHSVEGLWRRGFLAVGEDPVEQDRRDRRILNNGRLRA